MPTYDYECDGCGHTFEHFQYISEDPITDCPECKKPKLRRLFGTGAALVFKGSGFYQTDYRSDSYKKAAEADKKSSETSKSDSSSSDSSSSKSKSAESKSSEGGGGSKPGSGSKPDKK